MGDYAITITRSELAVICNALNHEAKHFDSLLESRADAPTGPRDVWRRKASSNRALAVKLLETGAALKAGG